MTELFERIAACETNVREMSLIQLQGIKQLEQVVDGAGAMRRVVEDMRRVTKDADTDLPHASEQADWQR